MPVQLQSNSPVHPVKRAERINLFFDCADVIVERGEKLLSRVAISVFLIIHLIVDLIIILVVLLNKSG